MRIKKLVLEVLKKEIGEYASAIKIHQTLNLSLSFIYSIVKNENIKSQKKYGRKEYHIESFFNVLELSDNNYLIKNSLSKEEFDINNFCNWEPKNEIEVFLEGFLLDELGEFTSIKRLVEIFGISKTTWHDILNQSKLMYFNVETRKVIITRSLLPYLREAMQEKE